MKTLIKRLLRSTIWGGVSVFSLILLLCTSGAYAWSDKALQLKPRPLAEVSEQDSAPSLVVEDRSDSAFAGARRFAAQVTPADTNLYMPMVFKNLYIAYDYAEGFGDRSTGWAHGTRTVYNSDGTKSDEYAFGYKEDSRHLTGPYGRVYSDGRVYYLWAMDDGDHVFVTGPSDKAYTNQDFTYEVSLRLASDNKELGDEYGILISPVPLDPKNPDSQGKYVYTLQIRLLPSNNADKYWVFKRWVIHNSHDHPADELAQSWGNQSWLTVTTLWWNHFKVKRTGNTLQMWTNAEESWDKSHLVVTRDLSLDFNPVPDKFYVGFYMAHSSQFGWRYDLEAQFENLTLHCTPR